MKIMTVLFMMRYDTISNLWEGEVYTIGKGVTIPNLWLSPRLSDHTIVVAQGKKAIEQVYEDYNHIHFTSIDKSNQ